MAVNMFSKMYMYVGHLAKFHNCKLNVLMCFIPGAIYLKNLVTQHWADREVESGQPLPFCVHEQDRAMIRDAVVDAVVHAPDLIRYKTGVHNCQHYVMWSGVWRGVACTTVSTRFPFAVYVVLVMVRSCHR